MGLFDKVMNSLFDSTKKALDSFANGTKPEGATQAETPAANPVNPAPVASVTAPMNAADDAERIYREDGTYALNASFHRDVDYFRGILASGFAGCTIEENVSISRIDATAHPKCLPVTFMITEGDRSIAFFVIKKGQKNAMTYRGSLQALDAAGIAHTHCITCYKNDAAYVVARIRAAMNA